MLQVHIPDISNQNKVVALQIVKCLLWPLTVINNTATGWLRKSGMNTMHLHAAGLSSLLVQWRPAQPGTLRGRPSTSWRFATPETTICLNHRAAWFWNSQGRAVLLRELSPLGHWECTASLAVDNPRHFAHEAGNTYQRMTMQYEHCSAYASSRTDWYGCKHNTSWFEPVGMILTTDAINKHECSQILDTLKKLDPSWSAEIPAWACRSACTLFVCFDKYQILLQ